MSDRIEDGYYWLSHQGKLTEIGKRDNGTWTIPGSSWTGNDEALAPDWIIQGRIPDPVDEPSAPDIEGALKRLQFEVDHPFLTGIADVRVKDLSLALSVMAKIREELMQLEGDMRRYVYDKEPDRRIQCLEAYRERLGLPTWAEQEQMRVDEVLDRASKP